MMILLAEFFLDNSSILSDNFDHADRFINSYEEAQEIIEGKEGDLKSEILTLDKIAKILRGYRLKNGALSIESEEMRFKLDENGVPIDIVITDEERLPVEALLIQLDPLTARPLPGKKFKFSVNLQNLLISEE